MDSTGEEFISWIHGRPELEKFDFLRRFLDVLSSENLDKVLNLVAKAKKRRVRSIASKDKNSTKCKKREASSVSVPGVPVSAPEVAVSVEEVSVSAQQINVSPTDVSVSVLKESASIPEVTVSIAPSSKPKAWWKRYSKSSFVSMDIEKVEYAVFEEKKKYELKAATVAIVDAKNTVIYSAKIYHAKNSFRLNKYSKTGFRTDDFINGKSLQEVQLEVEEILKDRCVIMIEAAQDFESLDLPIGKFDVFDIQNHWYQQHYSKKGKPIIEKLGLRSLCHHYYNGIDMQPSNVPHTAENDALWTLKLFSEIYTEIKTEEIVSRVNNTPFNEVQHYNPEKKKCECKYCLQ